MEIKSFWLAIAISFSISKLLLLNRPKTPVAIGGLAIIITCGISALYTGLYPADHFSMIFLIVSLLIFIVHIADDLCSFSPLKKIILQTICILIFTAKTSGISIFFLPGWANSILTFLWIMGITNAFNLLDIKDGFCVSISLVSAIFLCIISFITANDSALFLLLPLIGALIGFLPFNIKPAKAYLGNSGSHLIGFMFGVLTIKLDYSDIGNKAALFAPIILMAIPIIDSLFLLIARLNKKINPFHKTNHHIVMLLGKNRTKIPPIINLILLHLLWGISALLLISSLYIPAYIAIVIAIILTSFAVRSAFLSINKNP